MPLRAGYSRATVGANIAAEMDAGRKQSQAVAMALRSARKSYRARHPVGAYPAHLKRGANPISEETAHKLRRAAPGTFARMTDEEIKRAVKVKRRRSKARRNPAPLTKKSYVTRKSQITRAAPTRRLKKRRTKNWALGRRRVFPNPGARYIVQAKVPRSYKWVMLATYPAGMKRDAFQHARDYARTHPTHTVRVNLE